MRFVCLLLVLAAVTAVPASASAQRPPRSDTEPRAAPVDMTAPSGCVSRPDVAVLDEYCGALPSADDRGLQGPALRSILPPGTVRRLQRAGPIGDLLLAMPSGMAASTGGNRARGEGLDADDLLRSGGLGGPAQRARGPVNAVSRLLSDGVVHPAFGSFLLLSAVGMVGVAWRRARRRQRP